MDVEILNDVTITMGTSKEHTIKVLLPNDKYLVFKECNYGLYHLKINDINKDVMNYSCLQNFN